MFTRWAQPHTKGMRLHQSYFIAPTDEISFSPYNSASGQKTIQRQYSSYDPLYIKDLSVRVSRTSILLQWLTTYRRSTFAATTRAHSVAAYQALSPPARS
jgi:hypothetical protein